jgi:hypothetical protein
MQVIYIDNDYRCHVSNPDGTFREVKTDVFDGKCNAYIEGCRYVPAGEQWERADGEVFQGEMFSPAVDYTFIGIAQEQYDHDMAEADASYQEGVNAV